VYYSLDTVCAGVCDVSAKGQATLHHIRFLILDEFGLRSCFFAGGAASPAFVLDTIEDRHAWQYAMPGDAPAGCSKPGCGLGEYRGVAGPRAVVGVVGSAHVGGIVREWKQSQDLDRLSQLLNHETQ
jgi:hypothetical protein